MAGHLTRPAMFFCDLTYPIDGRSRAALRCVNREAAQPTALITAALTAASRVESRPGMATPFAIRVEVNIPGCEASGAASTGRNLWTPTNIRNWQRAL